MNFDPAAFFAHRFWSKRPDWVAINKALQIVYIIEFQRPTNRDEGFLQVKEAEANEQFKSIRCFSMIGALRAASPRWELEQINFVMGNRRSVC